MGKARATLSILTATCALAGCSFAPAYHPPTTPTPVAYKEAGSWLPATPADLSPHENWWLRYGDQTLNGLEKSIDTDNPTLAGALARYDEAAAYLTQSRSSLLPHVGIDADLSRNRQSGNRPLRGSNQPDFYAADTVSIGASYELDLWGRVRNSVAAGKAEAEASNDDVAAVRLSLEAELASAYVALRGYDDQLALLTATADAYAQADAVTERRFHGGIASGIDTGRSGAQLEEARAQLSEVKAARALVEHAIASFVGQPASNFAIRSARTELAMPVIPAGLPSTLLQRRPDVAAAERRMFAANAGIGVAKAAFFPALSLGGNIGVQNTGLPGLFSAPNTLWSIGPSTVLNLFDGGRRRGQMAVARANWTQTTAAYRAQVLHAFKDVEDNLSQLRYLGNEAQSEQQAEALAAQAERLSLNRYVKGAISYLDVVTAQTTALRIRRANIDLTTRRLQSSVGLVKALGGGWQATSAPLPRQLKINTGTS